MRVHGHSLALQIENLNTAGSSCAEPISVGRKDEGVDDITSLKGI